MTAKRDALRDYQGQRIGQLFPAGREPSGWLPRVIASLSRQWSTVIGNAFPGAICPNALATFAWFALVTCVDKRGVWQQIFEVPVAQHSAFAKKVIAPRMYLFLPRRSNDQNPCNLWCPHNPTGFHISTGQAHDLQGCRRVAGNHFGSDRGPWWQTLPTLKSKAAWSLGEAPDGRRDSTEIQTKEPWEFVREKYRLGHLIENFFASLKQDPGIATVTISESSLFW